MKSTVEPELPPIHAKPPLVRKRTLDHVIYNTSSDPPLFSSDDVSSTVENYSRPRTKQLRTGPWWSQTLPICEPSAIFQKRKLDRNFDSGVWMGSDNSIDDSEVQGLAGEDISEAELLALQADASAETAAVESPFSIAGSSIVPLQSSTQAATKTSTDTGQRSSNNSKSLPISSLAMLEKHRRALSRVQRCVDWGYETVDLSFCDAEDLPDYMLEPLRTLTPHRTCPMSSLEPKLRIYLAHNQLIALPPGLYDLQHIVELSLRQNHLKVLSHEICRLETLQTLNLSANLFYFLPWEIYWMPALCSVQLHPNPFFEPIYPATATLTNGAQHQVPSDAGITSQRHYAPWAKGLTHLKALSRVALLDSRGNSTNGPMPSRDLYALPLVQSSHSVNMDGRLQVSVTGHGSSLYEQMLRRSTVFYSLDELLKSLPDGVPEFITKHLQLAARQNAVGRPQCSVCKKEYVLPRAEWLEWWNGDESSPVPFLRRSCSWRCVPPADSIYTLTSNCGWKIPQWARQG